MYTLYTLYYSCYTSYVEPWYGLIFQNSIYNYFLRLPLVYLIEKALEPFIISILNLEITFQLISLSLRFFDSSIISIFYGTYTINDRDEYYAR